MHSLHKIFNNLRYHKDFQGVKRARKADTRMPSATSCHIYESDLLLPHQRFPRDSLWTAVGQPCAGSFVQTVRKLHLAVLRSDTNRGHVLTILVGIAIAKSHLFRFKMLGKPSKSPALYLEAVRRRATSYTSCSARPARCAPSFLVGSAPQSWAREIRICRCPPDSRSPPD